MHSLFPRAYIYQRLENDNEQSGNTKSLPKHGLSSCRWSSIRYFTSITIIMMLSFTAGFYFRNVKDPTDLDPLKFESNVKIFQYNKTFPSRPTNQTNRAWDELFPRYGGYFQHPEIAPSRSAFAVFHQLHCLDAIRQSYWLAFDAAAAGQKKTQEDYPFMTSPSHVRHCIDLIRNALLCQPDLTIEIKDETKGGVTGFGVEHECINWGSLLGWVGRWETYGRHQIG